MELSGQLGAEKDEASKGAVATGEVVVTDGLLAAIGAVVQGLLDKALSTRQPRRDVESGPSRESAEGKSGESLARGKGGGKCGQNGEYAYTPRA